MSSVVGAENSTLVVLLAGGIVVDVDTVVTVLVVGGTVVDAVTVTVAQAPSTQFGFAGFD